MNKKDTSKLQKFLEGLALRAGKVLLNERNKAEVKTRKEDYLDIVTSADLASETFLCKEIRKHFPNHSIISEENINKYLNNSSDFTWIIDPLDGTKEYTRGTPIFNVSISLEHKGELIVGAVFRPATNELFSVSKWNGAYLNWKKLHASEEKILKNSIIWAHLPYYKNSDEEAKLTWGILEELAKKSYRLRGFHEDVTILAWLALGALEGYILTISGPQWWDVAPGILMVEEAGGKVTNTYGDKIKNRDLSKGVVASNGNIHDDLLTLIAKHRKGLK